MYPYLLQSADGALKVPTYGMLVLTGFCVAFAFVHTHARRVGIRPELFLPLYAVAAVFGLIGARVLYMIAVTPQALLDPSKWLSGGGFAFYGGFLGGALGVLLCTLVMKLPIWKVADIGAPAVVLGLGIGRIGCFFAGCCHGAAAHVGTYVHYIGNEAKSGQIVVTNAFPFLLLDFHQPTMADITDVPVYPTQLWAAVGAIAIAGFLGWRWEHRKFDGQIAALMLMIEPVWRFFVESYRADSRGYVFSKVVSSVPGWLPPGFSYTTKAGELMVGLTTSQTIAIGMILAGIALYAVLMRGTVAPETPIADDVD